jgi:glycosyltransferase involved in cell wall biosynthesis
MSSPLRIVHAVRSDAFAGVEQFVLRLAIRQAHDGHLVRVVGGSAEKMQSPLAADGIPFHPAVTSIETLRAIRRIAADGDIVNTHMTAADVAGALGLAGRNRTALVSTRHFTNRRGIGSGIPFDALIGHRIDGEIAISRAVAASIGRPSTIVHSGVENVDDMGIRREPVVLMAQRLEAEKQTDAGIRAFARSRLGDMGWRLEIAGAGSERPRLEALARQLQVDARFLGFRDDVRILMQRAGILLAPCTVEGLGLAVLEAMASGLPVVAADAGGHTEILEGLDARVLYPPGAPDAASRNLASLAADAPGRAALGHAERERQRARFSIDAQAAGTESVYRSAAVARGAR